MFTIKLDKGSRLDVSLSILKCGDTLLDFGCGDGTFGYYAQEKYKFVHGVDISESAVKLSTEKGVIARKLDSSILPYEDSFFDTVTILDVLEHVKDPVETISEISRVIKRGGTLILSVPNMRYWKHLYDLVVCGRFPVTSKDNLMYDGGHIHYFTFKNIKEIIERYGFIVTKKMGVFDRNYCTEFLSSGIVVESVKL